MKDNCTFSKAWIGKCKNDAMYPELGIHFCEEHLGEKCVSCGEQATHECDETTGAFVCGFSLCDECEHTIRDNGCNSLGKLPGGLGAHCKRSEQVYVPWYVRDDESKILVSDYPEYQKRLMEELNA